jgi:type IV secretory pathway VirB4 component
MNTSKSIHQTPPKKAKNKMLSTQRYLQFAGVRDDTLILKDGSLRAVFEVSSINFNLKSEQEQNSIIGSYQKFLNALTFETQILVRSRKLDIDHYIESLKHKMKNIENILLKNQMDEYIQYIQKLVEYSDIMEKRFFVVVPVTPPRAQKKTFLSQFLSYIKPDDTVLNIITRRKEFRNLKKELDSRANVVQTALGNCGLSIKRLSTKEIIELFYQVYNPQLARNQKLASLEELAVSEDREQDI